MKLTDKKSVGFYYILPISTVHPDKLWIIKWKQTYPQHDTFIMIIFDFLLQRNSSSINHVAHFNVYECEIGLKEGKIAQAEFGNKYDLESGKMSRFLPKYFRI